MSKKVACIIARTTSTRLPLKVLRDCGYGYSIIELLIRRLKSVSKLDEIYLCTSDQGIDDVLEDIALREGIKIYRGSEDKVIERMVDVGKISNADILLRITGDNPLTSFEFVPELLALLESNNLDYVRQIDSPIGATVDVVRRETLEDCYQTIDPAISEYMMLFLFNPDRYKCGVLKPFKEDFSGYSLTVDTPEDLQRLKITLSNFPDFAHEPGKLILKEILNFYQENNDLIAMNITQSGEVKMPYGKIIDYGSFKADMKERENKSVKKEIY